MAGAVWGVERAVEVGLDEGAHAPAEAAAVGRRRSLRRSVCRPGADFAVGLRWLGGVIQIGEDRRAAREWNVPESEIRIDLNWSSKECGCVCM